MPGAKSMEVVLRLVIAPADIPRLRRLTLPKGWKRGTSRRKTLLSLYFDTPDLFLKQRAIVLWVRRDGRRWIQGVKAGGGVKPGPRIHLEIEEQVARDHPDFSKFDEHTLAELALPPELQKQLRPVFVTDFHRTTWLLESPSGDVVEMALDQGETRIDRGAGVPISEIELVLKSGNLAALYEAALILLEWVPLYLENASKMARGYALRVSPASQPPLKALPPAFRGDVSVSQAFQIVAWDCIGHLQGNHPGLLTGDDVEYVHQMRVALRRLRSAMGLFAKIVPTFQDGGLSVDVGWLAGELGAARDWDVFVTESLPAFISPAEDDTALRRLGDQALAVAVGNREKARQAANSQRYLRLLLNLGAWLNREAWRFGANKRLLAALDQPILKWSGRLLDKRHKQLLRRGAKLDGLSASERHMLRIAAKKLRYAAEFLAHLHPAKETGLYLKALADLQDVLGALNDHVVTQRLLGELRQGCRSDASLARAIDEIIDWDAGRASVQLEALRRAWKDFAKQKRFWK